MDRPRPILKKGWNTWDTLSVLTFTRLPEKIGLRLGIKHPAGEGYGFFLREAQIGRRGEDKEVVRPGIHAYDGSYIEQEVSWRGIELTVRSVTRGDQLIVMVTRQSASSPDCHIIVTPVLLWNGNAKVGADGQGQIGWEVPGKGFLPVTANRAHDEQVRLIHDYAYHAYPLGETPLVLAVGGPVVSVAEAEALMRAAKEQWEKAYAGYPEPLREPVMAMHSCLAWDTVYDPESDSPLTPVSRIWNVGWGGYVLFCWDTYFAALMMAHGDPELAVHNLNCITATVDQCGFVPNYAATGGVRSWDRSQPPVGSLAAWWIYSLHGDMSILETHFSRFLRWNRWWHEKRSRDGFLCWGSNPNPGKYRHYDTNRSIGNAQGAIFESGLDNSPMYDEARFDAASSLLLIADVGLMGLYCFDCELLERMAQVLGKHEVAEELRTRRSTYMEKLRELWNDNAGIFQNFDLARDCFSPRLSPTNFYPLLASVATVEQVERMVKEHFYNPAEFWGEWIIPSIARNDPGYPDQSYWRGRIWGPMNFLVYLG
ncbi:MAG: hypothetical protein D6820_11395, partial [Lentisphaerae bacterium]